MNFTRFTLSYKFRRYRYCYFRPSNQAWTAMQKLSQQANTELFHCKMIGRVIFRTLNKPGNRDVFPMMCKTLQVSTFCTESGVKQNIRDIAKNIDTTLTAEQKEYVDKLKKKIRGGVNSPRSLHREVPAPHEVVGMGNFMPSMAENAEALIDYALSHIPPRDGKRGSRRKKRMERKHESKRKYDAIAKKQQVEAHLRKQADRKRIRQEVKAVREEVRRLAEIRAMKAEVRRASAAARASASS